MQFQRADHTLRRAVWLVAVPNLAYFGIECAVARAIGSVSLFADSIDFLEDASIKFLILVALGWTTRKRARVGMALAGILLMPGLATLWTASEKFNLHKLGGTIMALNNRTKLGITLAVAVIAGLASVWLPVLVLVLAAFLIAWGQVPERTNAFVELLPGGHYLLKALARIDLLLWPAGLGQKDLAHEWYKRNISETSCEDIAPQLDELARA